MIDDDDLPEGLIAFLAAEAQSAADARRDGDVADAIDYYRGEKFGNEDEGRSQVVSRDVAEVIDQGTVNILETMVSGDRVVTFETDQDMEPGPDGVKPVDYGDQATSAVGYLFSRKQPGYQILHDACKAGLLEKRGVVKTFVERKFRVETYMVPGASLVSEHDFETIEPTDERAEGVDGPAGVIYRCTRKEPLPPVVRDMTVPFEEFFVSPAARCLDSAPYLAHVRAVTVSELRELGFDLSDEDADALSGTDQGGEVAAARDRGASARRADGATREVLLREEYAFFDYDGNGVTERICVHRVGDKVLAVEVVDHQPFSGWIAYPMPHRFDGDSLADKVMPMQTVNSALWRNALDSLYLSTSPRVAVHTGDLDPNTTDDLLDPGVNTIIRWSGNHPPTPFITPDTSAQAFAAMEFNLATRERLTGITRHNQGLQADSLNKTASGMAMLRDDGDKLLKYLARNFAEMCVARMFEKRYRLMRQWMQPFRMKIDGQPVWVDPREWPEEVDMAINVGLGSNRKDQRIQARLMVAGLQEKVVAAGRPWVKDEHLFNTASGIVRDADLGTPTDFFQDPATVEEQGEQPDPETVKMMAEAQAAERKMAFEQWKAEQGFAIERERMMMEDARERERMDREFALAAQRAMNPEAPAYHPGGSLAA